MGWGAGGWGIGGWLAELVHLQPTEGAGLSPKSLGNALDRPTPGLGRHSVIAWYEPNQLELMEQWTVSPKCKGVANSGSGCW